MMDNTSLRRKLLRGSLAAPIVLTVSPASALAASSALACIARAKQTQPATSLAFVATQDSWYRTEVDVFEGRLQGSAGSAGAQLFYKSGSNYYLLNATNCPLTSYTGLDFSPSSPPTFKYKRLGLVYVDDSGVMVGFGPCPNGGTAVSTSCWTSVVATITQQK